MKHFLLLNFLMLLLFSNPALGNNNVSDQQQMLTLKGRVYAGDLRDVLSNASVSVEGTNVSSVTNQDGYFTLRVPSSARNSNVIIRYLGYENKSIPVVALIDKPNNNIILNPSSIKLSELYVVTGDGSEIVKDALKSISKNYSSDPSMMVAFYRESIKKNSNYISLVEAVLDVYKASYKSYNDDQAKIYIGRKATDISPRDTVLMKFQGGISSSLMLDIAKHPDVVFDVNVEEYTFHIDNLVNINDKPHYAISFEPLPSITDILFRGVLYIEMESLAIARAEFNMNVENRKDASNIFIRRKPAKMKAEVAEAHYVVDFLEDNGKWYFNYSATTVSFKVRWTNRLFGLFSTNYTISSEIAITDRYNSNVVKFPRKERIRSSDVIAEKVEYFQDPDFWGDYNVIEPDLEINKAIKRLSGKLLRRNE